MPGLFSYVVSKAGLLGLTQQVAVESLEAGVTCNMVAPGWVDTPGNAATGRMEGAAQTIPLRRVAQPSEVAHWVVQLAGAGGYVTGETLVISGGSLIR